MDTWDELVGQLRSVPDLAGARCRGRWELFDAASGSGRDNDAYGEMLYARNAALRICTECPALERCATWLDGLPSDQRPRGVVAGQIITTLVPPRKEPCMKNITEHDLRRGARFCVAVYEKDLQVQKLVGLEVGREKRWMQHSMACALVCRIVLTKVDEAEEDEGAIALWLHSAVEQLIGDGLLDPRTDEDDT